MTARGNGREPPHLGGTLAALMAGHDQAPGFCRNGKGLNAIPEALSTPFLVSRHLGILTLATGTQLRPRRARIGHHDNRQRRLCTRGSILFRAEGRIGRLPGRLSADDEEGRERPARLARRGDRGQAGHAQTRGGRVSAWLQHPRRPFPRDGAEIPDTPRLTLIVADPTDRLRASRLRGTAAPARSVLALEPILRAGSGFSGTRQFAIFWTTVPVLGPRW